MDFPPFTGAPVPAGALAEGWRPVGPDGRGDVAVLQLEEDAPAPCGAPPLRRPPTPRGHAFRAYGFPKGQEAGIEATTTTGHRVERGFSGAPVWDEEVGAIVGIVVAEDRDPDARGAFMIPIAVLARAWPGVERAIGWRLAFDPDRERHWSPRARGVERETQPGFYFSGRERALGELARWLGQPDGRARVVTGGPGSGKSAVLARMVTLADPDGRERVPLGDAAADTIPPEGVIDLAVHLRELSLEESVARIAHAFDLEAPDAESLVDALIEQAGGGRAPRVIAFDALDEAAEPRQIALKLLRPLARDGGQAGVHLLVGTRRGYRDEFLEALEPTGAILDLDEEPYLDPEGLAAFVRRTLVGEGPAGYAEDPDLAGQVAAAVAARAGPSFLVARLVARALTEAEGPVDVREAGWSEGFPADVGAAMDLYLDRLARGEPQTERRLRDLLAPLAWAEGPGLPDDDALWPALASALARRPYAEADVASLLETAASYIVEGSLENGRRQRRLFHEALAEHLRGRGEEPIRAQGRITEALLADFVPLGPDGARDWRRAHPYASAHLATHAAVVGGLDELLQDPGLLIVAPPSHLLRALPAATAPQSAGIRRAYLHALHGLRAEGPEERASDLEVAAHQVGEVGLAERIGEVWPGRPWDVGWARWRRPAEHFVLGRHGAAVGAAAFAAVGGRQLAVSGGYDGTLRVWDLERGEPVGAPLTGHEGRVMAVALGEHAGRPVIVAGGWDGAVRVWDLERGEPVGAPLGQEEPVLAVALGERAGRPVIVSGGDDGTLRVWDLERGELVGTPLTGHDGSVMAVALGERSGRPVIVSGGVDGTVRTWDASGERGTVLHLGSSLAALAMRGEVVAVGTRMGLALLRLRGPLRP